MSPGFGLGDEIDNKSPLVQVNVWQLFNAPQMTGLILGLRSANERRRYFVKTSVIGWVQA